VAVSVRTGGPTGAAAYAEAGVDELIVGDDAFGQGPDKLAALVAVMSDLTAALG
jgi:hypothetical protein